MMRYSTAGSGGHIARRGGAGSCCNTRGGYNIGSGRRAHTNGRSSCGGSGRCGTIVPGNTLDGLGGGHPFRLRDDDTRVRACIPDGAVSVEVAVPEIVRISEVIVTARLFLVEMTSPL